MKRTKEIKVRLTEKELDYLNTLVGNTGLSRESFVRSIIKGVIPPASPSSEYLETLRTLRYISNNLNQIAIEAHVKKSHDAPWLLQQVTALNQSIAEIKVIASKPSLIERK